MAAERGDFEVAIIGAGFSGLAMVAKLREAGVTDLVALERGDDVGGTWRDNSYPGCACDVPSHLYSFAFAPNPEWSSTFSPQPEIQAYLRRVAADRGLLQKVRFRSEVQRATWSSSEQRWQIETASGPLTARVLVSAAGPFSEPAIPKLAGLEHFEGAVFHSARWDHAHDLDGERVAVIGTGASSIQIVPQIQPRVAQLQLYQRTAAWILPRRARSLTRFERALYRRSPAAQRAMRDSIYWARETYAIPLIRAGLSPLTRRLGTMNIARHIKDPDLRAKVTPDYAPGCKRILISDDYLPALTRPNVEVITTGIREVRTRSIVSDDGVERNVDTIIFGTGFHVTDVPLASRLYGRAGESLRDVWSERHAGVPRHRGGGFSEPVLPAGAEHGAGTHVCRADGGMASRLRRSGRGAHAPARCRRARRSGLGAGRVERAGAEPHEAHRVAGGRMHQLLPRPRRPQHHALAGLHLSIPPRHAPLRS